MSKLSLSWLRNLFVPVIIVSVLFVAFGAFYLYWVPNRQRHLDDRGFRYLNTLSEQIRLTINNYDKMLDNAVDADITSDILPMYLNHVAPQLTVSGPSEAKRAVGNDWDDPPKIAVEADEGTHFLYLAFQRVAKSGGSPTTYVVQTDLDKLINDLLGSPNLNPFDVVLVARGDGKVIFQKSLSGVEVAQIKNLEDASGQAPGNAPKRIDVSTLSATSRLEEVRIAGARYRLYSQPVSIGFFPAHPNRHGDDDNAKGKSNKVAAGTGHPQGTLEADASTASANDKSAEGDSGAAGEEWVLCGLVRADRFRSEGQLIPYSYILITLALILLAAASYPYVRLYLSLPGERLRARDVAVTAVFTCFIVAVVTFVLTDIYFWNRGFGPKADKEMATLARAIDNNFQIEQQAAFDELEAFDKNPNTSSALPKVSDELQALKRENVGLIYGNSDEDIERCKPDDACKVDILVKPEVLNDKSLFEPLRRYPYPFFAFWSDFEGNQRIKWTTRRRSTPFVSLDDASIPFYPEVKRALKRPVHSDGVRGVGSQYSPTTGQNITTFWTVSKDPDSPGSNTSEDNIWRARYCAALVSQPVSVYNAVLPGAYQFAVLSPDGTVVFHSDPTRNLRENFLAETDLNPNLHSRVRMRAEGTVTANYLGLPHRMYVLPMKASNQDGPLTIVIFRDLHMEEVMNLEIVSLVSILFLLYAGAMALIMLSVHWGRKDKSSRAWFWPDSRKSPIYRQRFIVNLAAACVVLVLSRLLPGLALMVCVGLVSAGVILFNMSSLRRKHDPQTVIGSPSQLEFEEWCPTYFLAVATLVLAMAVVPCFSFFQVAAVFEHRVLIQHALLQFATDLENRDLAVRTLYQDAKLGGFESTVLADPESQHSLDLNPGSGQNLPESPVFSYHELLQVSFPDSTKPSSLLSTVENSFLSAISYPYNERASDDRHLAEGKSDVNQWSTSRSGGDRVLALTQRRTTGHRIISVTWQPIRLAGLDWLWWLVGSVFLVAVYWLVRFSATRIFLLNLVAAPPAQESGSGMDPNSLIADLPMNLLLIGRETSRPISGLLHRSDVQVYEAIELQEAMAPAAKPGAESGSSRPAFNPIDAMIRNGRPLILRNFERLSDDPDSAARMLAAINRLVSALGNSVILVSSVDPILVPSIEASDRWRNLLRSFVRIDLNTTSRQRVDEDDAEYQSRISAESYFHWLFAGLPKLDKLVMLQLAQEKVLNPNDRELIDALLEQGMIERKSGLLAVKDDGFAKFLKHALPRHTVKQWEKGIAGGRPLSLQTSLMIVGVGVVAFLVYTQGDVFNTWVTYATGVASAVPKLLQLLDNLRSKTGAAS